MEVYGSYILLKTLGSGAMGEVSFARPIDPHRGIPTPVVVKRLHAELSSNESMKKRFVHEAEIAMTVDAPQLAKVYEVGSVGETLFMASEHIAGWSFSELTDRAFEQKKMWPLAVPLELMRDVLKGLMLLHGAIDPATGAPLRAVHRDLSPRNLMLSEDGLARIIDLGIGRSSLADWKTQTGRVLGSPGYMPPEQVAGDRVDHRSDLYTAGIVLWELVTMRRFIEVGPLIDMLRSALQPKWALPSALRPNCPQQLDAILLRALAPRAEQRYQSAAEFLADLDALAGPSEKMRPAVLKMIAEFFGGDLSKIRAERARLLEEDLPPAALDPTVIHTMTSLARRTGVGLSTVTESRSVSKIESKASRRLPLWSAPLFMVAGLIVGWALALQQVPVAVQPAVAPAVVVVPRATAGERTIETTVETPAALRTEKKRVEKPREQQPEVAPRERVEPEVAPVPAVDPETLVKDAIARARKLRSVVETDEDRAAIERILSNLLVQKQRITLPDAKATVIELDRALRAFE